MDSEGTIGTYSPRFTRFVFGKNPSVTLLRIVVLTIMTLIIFKFVLLPIRVTGESMYPTYKDGQVRFVNRLTYMREEPQRGDVVAVEFRGQQILLLKRIIGLPNERFDVFNGEVFINGKKLTEPYANGKILSGTGLGSTTQSINLGATEYMVIGDNRPVSEGYVKDRKQIVGKVL